MMATLLHALVLCSVASATVTFNRTAVSSPYSFSPSAAAAVRGTFYFLGEKSDIISYNLQAETWDKVPVSADIAGMLDGTSFTGVEAVVPGIDDFLVVSGGGTKDVVYYNIQTHKWMKGPSMQNKQKNSCSISCRGYWFSMTGDMSKMIPANGRLLKPANRQVYRYNLTSGEHFENSGKKERGGAGCGCDPVANRVFWEGGSSNSGLSDNVEVWGVDPLHRGGEPIFKADTSLRDVGATACGGYFVGVGGNTGKEAVALVNVFLANSTTDGSKLTLDLGVALTHASVQCLAGRYVVISGGYLNGKSLNTNVMYLDTQSLPLKGSKLAILPALTNLKGQIVSATDAASGVSMFFDGTDGELFEI